MRGFKRRAVNKTYHKNQVRKEATQLKKQAEYYKKYIHLNLQSLINKYQKETKLAESLNTELELLRPKYGRFRRLDIDVANIKSRLATYQHSVNAVDKALENHQEYSDKFFIKKFFSPRPKHTVDRLKEQKKQDLKKIANLNIEFEILNAEFLELKLYFGEEVTIEELGKRLKSLTQRVTNSNLRMSAQEKAIEFLQAKERAISDREQKFEQKLEAVESRVETYKAYAAAYFENTRKLGNVVKTTLLKQEELVSGCPYCGSDLGEIPHADHIHPISRGGLSVSENMVLVCSDCNLKKSSHSLRRFIIKQGLNREVVEQNLEALNKVF